MVLILRKFLKHAGVFIIVIILLLLLLVLSCMIPKKYIHLKTAETSAILQKETNKYKIANIEIDNYTDALMINTIYSIDTSTPFYSAMVARKNYIPRKTQIIFPDTQEELKSASKYSSLNQVGELKDVVNSEEGLESFEYARYWHGYITILRPMLLLFNILEIRNFSVALLSTLAIIMLYQIQKRINLKTAIIFLIGLVLIDYFMLGLSLQGLFVLYITILSSLYILIRFDKIKSEKYTYIFMVIGMLTVFFDLLTTPIMTLCMPLLIYLLLIKKQKKITFKEEIISIIKYSIFWGIGYGGMWFAKWLLVDIIYNRNLIITSINQILYRSVGDTQDITSILAPVKANLFRIITKLNILIVLGYIYIFYKVIKYKGSIKIKIKENLSYLIVAFIPIVWYIVLRNHSLYHAFFTCRSLSTTIIGVLLFFSNSFKKSENGIVIEKNKSK